MHRTRNRDNTFALTLCGIAVIGLLSALIDGTMGWEELAQTVIQRANH